MGVRRRPPPGEHGDRGDGRRLQPTAIVALNRAVAVAEASGPGAGLAALDQLGGAGLDRHHPYHATRAELLRRLGRPSEAAAAYRAAITVADNAAERRFLEARLSSLGPAAGGDGDETPSDG